MASPQQYVLASSPAILLPPPHSVADGICCSVKLNAPSQSPTVRNTRSLSHQQIPQTQGHSSETGLSFYCQSKERNPPPPPRNKKIVFNHFLFHLLQLLSSSQFSTANSSVRNVLLEQNMTVDSEINQKDKSNSNEKKKGLLQLHKTSNLNPSSLDFSVPFGLSGG